MNICQDNMRCKENPETCGYSIECSCFDKGKDNYFITGIDCPNKWKEIDRKKEIGSTDKPIETSEFPVYKPNCNLTTCRYNVDSKCENEEKRKECVEVSIKVLCLGDNEK